ncbi:hypothetical protein LBMAG56_06050 [Verrucomicrobiota bacterium]|nr:hypothetical protein LBMAG56_06050 [Verrucomicrobiota bacterium]
MQHANERGVIHRDLKPSNILLGEQDHPYVADFGLARSLTSDARMTLSGALLGTPHYLAPERLDSRAGNQTVAGDLYSLGAILYELLAGEPPYTGTDTWQIIARARIGDPLPPLSRFRQNDPAVYQHPAAALLDLQTICLKCLDKEPARRYASAAELADELERVAAGQRILARPVTRLERAARWLQREPLLASLVSALLLVLGIALVAAVSYGRAMAARARAEQQLLERSAAETHALQVRVNQSLLADAERDLGLQRPAHAAASVAAVLRSEPQHPTAASWAKYFATQVAPILVPASAAVEPLGAPRLLAALSADVFLVQEGPRAIRRWSAQGGGPEDSPGFTAPSDMVAVDADPAGRRVVASCADGSAWLWEPDTAAAPRPFAQFKTAATLIRLSADASAVLLVGDGGFVRRYDLPGGAKSWAKQWHAGTVTAVAWDPHQKLALSAGEDGRVMVWNADTGEAIGPDLKYGGVHSLAFNHDGTLFGHAGRDHAFRLRSSNPERGFPLDFANLKIDRPISQVAILATNTCLIVANEVFWFATFRRQPGDSRWLRQKIWEREPAGTLRWSPAGTLLSVPKADGGVVLYDPKTCEAVSSAIRTDAPILEALPGPDGAALLVRRADGKLQFLPANPDDLASHSLPVGEPTTAEFVLQGHGLLTRNGGRADLWPLPAATHPAPPRAASIRLGIDLVNLVLSPAGNTLAVQLTNTLQFLSLTENPPGSRTLAVTPLGPALPLTNAPRQLLFTPDGKKLLLDHGTLATVVIETATGQTLATWTPPPAPAPAPWLLPDNESVLLVGTDGVLHRLGLATGTQLAHAPIVGTAVGDAALDPAGEFLALADFAGRVQVHSARTCEPLAPVLDSRARLVVLRFSADGRRLLTAGTDGIATLWDWRAGRVIGQPLAAAGNQRTVDAALWPGRDWLVHSTRNKRFRLWNLADQTRPVPDFYSTHAAPPALITPNGEWLVLLTQGRARLLAFAGHDLPTPLWYPDFLEDYHGSRRQSDGTFTDQSPLPAAALRAKYPLTTAPPPLLPATLR